MRAYSLTTVGDQKLLNGLKHLVTTDRKTTADLLAHIAEVDARRLYAPAGYPSMFEYCVRELGLSEDATYKRVRAARTARRIPALFDAVAAGHLHLSAVVVLASHLTTENAVDLIKAASGKSRAEIEQLLANRFPRPAIPTSVQPIAGAPQLAPGPVPFSTNNPDPGPTTSANTPSQSVKPLAPETFALQTTIQASTHEKLQHAIVLLSHRLPSGDLPAVLDAALDALIEKLEKQRLAATSKPRHARPPRNPRTIPASVRREVWARDGGRCTFTADTGKRCGSRHMLEFDHATPVALGGKSDAANIRLRCRAHNQHEADEALGAGLMHRKREASRSEQANRDVLACLQSLGYRKTEAREAAAFSARKQDASLEERVKLALSWFRPKGVGSPAPRARTA